MAARIRSNHKRRQQALKKSAQASREARAMHRWNRMSARKTREVVGLIRGKSVDEAIAILRLCTRRASIPTLKALKAAMANAHEVKKMKVDDLYVARAYVEEGPTIRRFLPRARGRADRIRKRSSHTVIILKERKAGGR